MNENILELFIKTSHPPTRQHPPPAIAPGAQKGGPLPAQELLAPSTTPPLGPLTPPLLLACKPLCQPPPLPPSPTQVTRPASSPTARGGCKCVSLETFSNRLPIRYLNTGTTQTQNRDIWSGQAPYMAVSGQFNISHVHIISMYGSATWVLFTAMSSAFCTLRRPREQQPFAIST